MKMQGISRIREVHTATLLLSIVRLLVGVKRCDHAVSGVEDFMRYFGRSAFCSELWMNNLKHTHNPTTTAPPPKKKKKKKKKNLVMFLIFTSRSVIDSAK